MNERIRATSRVARDLRIFFFGTKVSKENYCGKENNVDDIGL